LTATAQGYWRLRTPSRLYSHDDHQQYFIPQRTSVVQPDSKIFL
jgi:hypothetical protein